MAATTGLSFSPLPPVSVVHSLTGGFGKLHAGSLPEHALQGLREECWGTSCDAIHHSRTTILIDPRALDLLHQTDQGAPHETALLKLPDGYILFQPRQDNQILSVIKDAPLCVPEDTHPTHIEDLAPNGAKTVFYSLVPDLAVPREQRRAFRVAFHDGYTRAHEISRFCMADHAIAQIAAAIPLDTTPRVIMRSEPLGTLFGQALRGDDADLVKRTFLNLAQADPERIYDTPIETSETLARLLQLKNPKGNISLARLRDGVLAYRKRADGQRSFIFVANSDDFHADAPAEGDKSLLHIYKMLYKDPSPQGPRLFVNVSPKQTQMQAGKRNINVLGNHNHIHVHPPLAASSSGEAHSFGVPPIRPGEHSVQQVLGLIEMAMRYAGREHAGCGAFPTYCAEEAQARLASAPIPLGGLELHAAQQAIAPPQREPLLLSSSDEDEADDSESSEEEELPQRAGSKAPSSQQRKY